MSEHLDSSGGENVSLENVEKLSFAYDGYAVVTENSHRSSSGVWKYFGNLKKGEQIVDAAHVYCCKCFADRMVKKYQKNTSTGNLAKHLKRQHSTSLQQSFKIKKDPNGSVIKVIKEDPNIKTEVNKVDDSVQYADESDEEDDDGNVDSFMVHDLNEILINEVAQRPALYDVNAINKKPGTRGKIRRELWEEIYENLGRLIPLEKLPKIWKNIRDRYQKVKRDTEKCDDKNEKPKYRYYHLLRFLDDIEKRPVNSSIGKYLSNFVVAEDGELMDPLKLSTNAIAGESFSPPLKRIKIDLLSDEEHDYDKDHQSDSMLLEDDQIESIEMNTDDLDVQLVSDMSNKETDEFDLFGNFVAEVMRNMPKSSMRKFQMKILELINECENKS